MDNTQREPTRVKVAASQWQCHWRAGSPGTAGGGGRILNSGLAEDTERRTTMRFYRRRRGGCESPDLPLTGTYLPEMGSNTLPGRKDEAVWQEIRGRWQQRTDRVNR